MDPLRPIPRLLTAAVVLVTAACAENPTEMSDDADLPNVVWTMIDLEDSTGPVLTAFQAEYTEHAWIFFENFSIAGVPITEAEIRVLGADTQDSAWVYGSYTLNTAAGTGSISLTRRAVLNGTGIVETTISIPVTFTWTVNSAEEIVIETAAGPLNAVLGTNWNGTVRATLMAVPIQS